MKHLTAKLYLIMGVMLLAIGAATRFALGFLKEQLPTGLPFIVNILVVTSALICLTQMIKSLIVDRINRLSRSIKEVAKGNYDIQLEDHGADQISQLTSDFNLMTNALKRNEYLSKEFVRNFSHELKTPITSIKGFAELICDNDLSMEEIKTYTKIISDEADRLLNTSQQILLLSRLDSTNTFPLEDIYNLDSQIRKIILLLQPQWQAKSLELEVDLDNVLVKANEEILYFVWTNLISNAVKYSRNDGSISVSLHVNDKIVFEVKDTGIGMSDEDRSQIFQMFYTGNKARDSKNSGLGLTIVKTIVEKFKGSITCESTENVGSIFRVELGKEYIHQ